jgi:hypothetical protein
MRLRVDDRVRLLYGRYRTPKLRRGDRAFCLHLDCTVVITGLSDAPISWPLCRHLDNRMGRPTLLLADDLARAVRNESAAAVMYWWRVSPGVVWRWRKALEVTRTSNRGTRRLIHAASECGASKQRGVPLSAEQVERCRRTAIELGLGRNLRPENHPLRWVEDEIALLGVMPDEEVARLTGRNTDAVRQKREKLGLANPSVPPGSRVPPVRWTAEEDRLVREVSPAECASRTGRKLTAVYRRHHELHQPERKRLCGRPRLRVGQVLAWAIEHYRRTGQWPTRDSGAVGAAPGETWSGVDAALRVGCRGFRGGDTLAILLRRYRRGARYRPHAERG